MILIEQPLLSYLYLRHVMQGLLGAPGVVCFRSDDCMVCGTPWQKARAWVTTCKGIADRTAVRCIHPTPHPERLVGAKTRQSAPYGRELVSSLVEGAIAELQNVADYCGISFTEWLFDKNPEDVFHS